MELKTLFKNKALSFLPSFLLVSVIGVDAAYCIKNDLGEKTLNAASQKKYTGYMHLYEENKGYRLSGSGTAKFVVAASADIAKTGVSGNVTVSGKVVVKLEPIWRRRCYKNMGCWTACEETEWMNLNSRFWGSSNKDRGCD